MPDVKLLSTFRLPFNTADGTFGVSHNMLKIGSGLIMLSTGRI